MLGLKPLANVLTYPFFLFCPDHEILLMQGGGWEVGNPVLGRPFLIDFYHHAKGYVQLKILVVLTI